MVSDLVEEDKLKMVIVLSHFILLYRNVNESGNKLGNLLEWI